LLILSCQVTNKGLATKIEEYVPANIPIKRANINVWIEAPPKK
jgi:hypothetical protein